MVSSTEKLQKRLFWHLVRLAENKFMCRSIEAVGWPTALCESNEWWQYFSYCYWYESGRSRAPKKSELYVLNKGSELQHRIGQFQVWKLDLKILVLNQNVCCWSGSVRVQAKNFEQIAKDLTKKNGFGNYSDKTKHAWKRKKLSTIFFFKKLSTKNLFKYFSKTNFDKIPMKRKFHSSAQFSFWKRLAIQLLKIWVNVSVRLHHSLGMKWRDRFFLHTCTISKMLDSPDL